MRRLIFIASLVFLPALLQAQVRGGAGRTMISAPRVMARTGPVAGPVAGRVATGAPLVNRTAQARPVGSVNTTSRRVNNRQNAGSVSNQNELLPDFTGVPGLGFDYVHYAATHPNAGRRHGAHGGGFFPFFDSGFLLPYAPSYAADQPDDSPNYESQPQASAAAAPDAGSSERRYSGYGLEAVSSYDVIVAPQKPSESFVFVRRDGTLFFAVAYSWADGTLYYVTQEGLRRSVGRDALDLDATQQFNEQRGLSFRSPA